MPQAGGLFKEVVTGSRAKKAAHSAARAVGDILRRAVQGRHYGGECLQGVWLQGPCGEEETR